MLVTLCRLVPWNAMCSSLVGFPLSHSPQYQHVYSPQFVSSYNNNLSTFIAQVFIKITIKCALLVIKNLFTKRYTNMIINRVR